MVNKLHILKYIYVYLRYIYIYKHPPRYYLLFTIRIYRINAVTLLISIISLGNAENRNEVGRLGAIFDLMDFSHNSQISLDELVSIISLSFFKEVLMS